MRTHRFYGCALLVALLFTVYTLTNSGGFHIIDEVSLFAVTESLVQRGQVNTNAIAWTQWVNSPGEVLGAFGPEGDVYSKKGPAPAFLSAPWYALIRLAARLGLPWGLLQGTLLWNGVVTAATAALLWLTAVRLGYDDRTGALLGLLFGLATIAWPYANHLFGEPLSAFSLLFCFHCTLPPTPHAPRPLHRLWPAGLAAGIAIATVTAHAFLIALFGLYLLWPRMKSGQAERGRGAEGETRRQGEGERGREKGEGKGQRAKDKRETDEATLTPHAPRPTHHALRLALPVLAALALLGWYNFARFGNPLDTGYHFDSGEGFTTPLWQGFWGLILSPYRGIFWHTPLFLASLLAFPAFLRRHRAEGLLIAGLSMALIGLYSQWWMWWGGFAWGPRFLVPLAPFWVLLLAPLVEKPGIRHWGLERQVDIPHPPSPLLPPYSSLVFITLTILSLVVQLSAVLVNYVNYEIELRGIFPTDWADPLKFGPPAQALAAFPYSPVVGQWRLILGDFVTNTDLAWLWADGTVLWPVVIVGTVALALLSGALIHLYFGSDGITPADLPHPRQWGGAWGVARRPSPVAHPPTNYGLRLTILFRKICAVRAHLTQDRFLCILAPLRLGVKHYALLPILLFLLPLLVMAVWLGTVGQNPRYGQAGRGYRAALAEIAGKATPADGVVTVTPFHYQIPMNWYGGVYPAHRAGRWTTVGGGLPFYGYATDSADHPETVQVLARALRTHPQLWYVTGGLPPADPSNTVERWLAEHAFKAEDRWFDDFRLVRYGTPATLGDAPFRPVDVLLADAKSRVHLTGVRTPEYARPGVVLPVEIGYRLEQPAESPLRWFVQLLGADGAPVALLDTAPQDGYVPFPDLPAGVELRERAGLVLPPDLPTGRYRLIAGLYDPEQDGAPRLRTTNGEDTVELAPIRLP